MHQRPKYFCSELRPLEGEKKNVKSILIKAHMWETVALTALCAARRVQDVEAVLAVLSLLELVEDAVGERTEALGATKWGKNRIIIGEMLGWRNGKTGVYSTSFL